LAWGSGDPELEKQVLARQRVSLENYARDPDLLAEHVGMEDNFFLEKGIEAKSNAQLVEKAVTIIRLLGGAVATPTETRAMLGVART